MSYTVAQRRSGAATTNYLSPEQLAGLIAKISDPVGDTGERPEDERTGSDDA